MRSFFIPGRGFQNRSAPSATATCSAVPGRFARMAVTASRIGITRSDQTK
jgi:hypothetical protein